MDINKNNNANFNLDVALGKYHDGEHVQVKGNNPSFTTVDPINPAGTTLLWPIAPFTLNVLAAGNIADDSRFVGILTMGTNILDTETITIGSKEYTFQTSLTNFDGNVHIGVSASATLDNLIAAVSLESGGGTDYAAAMVVHPDIATDALTVEVGAGDTINLTATSALVTTETGTDVDFATGTLLIGAGANTLIVKYLDANFREREETIALLGATASAATSRTAIRLLSATVGVSGTYGGVNTGTITIENSNSDVFAIMAAGAGTLEAATYTVPVDKTAYITGINLTAGTANTVNAIGWKRSNADDVIVPFKGAEKLLTFTELSGNVKFTPDNYIRLEEKTDIWWEGARATGSTNAALTVIIDMILVDNL